MADLRMVALSQLDDPGLESLARLHQSVMRTLLTDLGLPVILRYYQIARRDDAAIGFCLRSTNGDLLGWVIGSPHPAALNARLRRPVRWLAGQLFRLATTQPGVLWQLALSAESSSSQRVAEGVVELTYLGIVAEERGTGLGQSLLQAFIDAARAAGYKVVELSVERENQAALGLYAKFGFVVKRTFTEGRFERRRMESVL